MNVQILPLILILSLLCRLEAKAFQTDLNTGNNDHMYGNLYLKKTAGLQSHPEIYSDHQSFEMRYVPHVDGSPIIIPSNFNELQAFPTIPPLKIRPKQWQYRYQFKNPHGEKATHSFPFQTTPKTEMKSNKVSKYDIQSQTGVETLTKDKEIVNEMKNQGTYNTENLKYVFERPQLIRQDNLKEISTQKNKHNHILPKKKVYEYDSQKVKGVVNKGQAGHENTYNKNSISDKNVKEPDYEDYDSPEVIDTLINENSKEPYSLDYDSPVVKYTSDNKSNEKVDKKQIYKDDASHKVIVKNPNPSTVKQQISPKTHGNKVATSAIQSSTAVSVDSLSKMPSEFAQITELSGKPSRTPSTLKMKEYDTPKVTRNQKNKYPNEDYLNRLSSKGTINNKEVDKKDLYEYDNPVVVEALVKRSQIYFDDENSKVKHSSNEDYSDYESPVVVEALTKKKPAENIEKTELITVQKEAKPELVTKDSFYQSYKYPIYFDSEASKGYKDFTKPKIALNIKTPSPILNFKDNAEDSNTDLITKSPLNDEADPDILNDGDQFDGSGLVDARSLNNEESRSLFLKSNVWSLSNFHSQERGKFKKCLTPTKEPGNCMPIQMCPVPNLQLTLDDLLKKVCTIDEVFIGICCPEFPAETLKVQWDNMNQNFTVGENNTDVKPEECGLSHESGDNVQSWPWMAPLISVSTRRIFCGGVLIKERYVLTAAHCTRKIPHNQILVVLGALNSEQDPINKEFAVVEIKRHAQYNPRTMQNDIALLKLSRKVPLGDKRRFICLPDEEEMNIGNEAFMLGWQGSFAASKNKEALRVVSPDECRKGVKIAVGPNIMCTEPRTEDVMCNLDSGAPLTVKRDGKYHVIGIMTWNRNDCDSSFPTIFTRVSHFKKWIENHSS